SGGKDKGKKKKRATGPETLWYALQWRVPYEPGTLKAVAKRGGRTVAADEVVTAAAPAKLELAVDRATISADGQDLAYVTVRVLDASGHICPDAANLVHFDLSGAGTLAAVGNGNPIDHDDFQATQRKAFHGLCLAIVKAGKAPGGIKLRASSDG